MSADLHEYRITKLEEAYENMSSSLEQLVTEAKLAKWVIGLGFAVLQPLGIGLLIHYMTR